MAPVGRYLGPFRYIHMADTSSYGVGNCSAVDQMAAGSSGSSTVPLGGVIHALNVTVPTVSATAAAFTLTVDGNTSTISIGASTFGTVVLDIGFSKSFQISCSSATTSGVLTFATIGN